MRLWLVAFAIVLLAIASQCEVPDGTVAPGTPAPDSGPGPLATPPPADTPEPTATLGLDPDITPQPELPPPTPTPVPPPPPPPPQAGVPPLEVILAAAARAFPEQPDKARRVTFCELGGFANPLAFRLDRTYGGPMQISRSVWEAWFLANYGWTWPQLALDLDIHFAAARVIYNLAGGWGPWPVCGLR